MTFNDQHRIEISISNQKLFLMHGRIAVFECEVSTALNGAGQLNGSGCTPLGKHRIRIKIGENCPANTVFIGRRPTGEIYTPELATQHPDRDWILTRILWLTGCESAFNRGTDVDSLRRYIYMHGTPATEPMGQPLSHGCIRMRNEDIITLFDLVEPGQNVIIKP